MLITTNKGITRGSLPAVLDYLNKVKPTAGAVHLVLQGELFSQELRIEGDYRKAVLEGISKIIS